ncbi:hypothetical protein BmR1_04g09185 [Babesia microti strain RI]|uniref:N-acetyltransferase domain-containing protein n=1 Tax=Babesia microti (strain RI) TaxID=1133968 RepID=I7J9R4_BABMR|nr:hypothetical protein BmR1_04g09185 [Babesia microti strain RI]CCF76013.1 hypothetical protein BmR1_04g09185 [Babesia microti strain RI]|eukprot:XP_012650421.1 hypothetical protein BmR1_04g09185 [Babesia microti strain RI]
MNETNDDSWVYNECSDQCTDVLIRKIEISKNFTLNNLSFTLQLLSTYDVYLEARKLVSMVSRCSIVHNERFINELLKSKLFYPIAIKLSDSDTSSCMKGECIIGYFEIYLMPHLGRAFDGRIERMIVHPQYRNIGVCQKMMASAIELCKNNLMCNRIDLYAENEIAKYIYTKFGFSQVHTNVYRLSLI